MHVDADFEAGAIEVVSAGDPRAIEVALRPDTRADYMQWFAFRLLGAQGVKSSIRIVNADQATFSAAWDGYRVAASRDQKQWFRVPTRYEGGQLVMSVTPQSDSLHLAYFAPYSLERHDALLYRAVLAPHTSVDVLGQSIEGRDMSLVVVGDEDPDKLKIWINARQHPGETMAEWFADGVLSRLLDTDDELTCALLEKATLYLMPNMNPDGSALGNLRTNAAGTDLNRAWESPNEEISPEVLWVRRRMEQTGVDLFLDIHGDERNPYVFTAGCEGNPSYSERIEDLEEMFAQAMLDLDPDYQREYGYPRDAPGEGDLSTAGNWVGETFDCLSLTLEMPFKDAANHPNPRHGWSPDRARNLGRNTLESVFVCLDSLR
jgi:murein tripeptide amidase MpaA